jgi:hypothetical protein
MKALSEVKRFWTSLIGLGKKKVGRTQNATGTFKAARSQPVNLLSIMPR